MMALRMAAIVFCMLLMIPFALFGVVFGMLIHAQDLEGSDIAAPVCFVIVIALGWIMSRLFKSRKNAMRKAG